MANPHRGEFDLRLNGTTYRCKLGLDALTEFQEMFRPPGGRAPKVAELIEEVRAEQLKYIRALMLCALMEYQPDLTPKDVSAIIDEADPAEIRSLMGRLGASAQPDAASLEALGVNGRPTNAAPTTEDPGRQTRKRATRKSGGSISPGAPPG